MPKLQNVILIAADTMRSRAYAQAMQTEGISVSHCLFIKRDTDSVAPDIHYHTSHLNNILIPDLAKPLMISLEAICSNLETIQTGSVNSQQVIDYIESLQPDLIIYSGFGGQIVSSKVLKLGVPFLHLHSGWLPDYRGSTTVYYSIINQEECAVSAILLEPKIDTGSILARRKYPVPPADLDIDYLYDTAIRADLLVDVLLQWSKNNRTFDQVEQQTDKVGSTYFVIHPLLKHLALMSLK